MIVHIKTKNNEYDEASELIADIKDIILIHYPYLSESDQFQIIANQTYFYVTEDVFKNVSKLKSKIDYSVVIDGNGIGEIQPHQLGKTRQKE